MTVFSRLGRQPGSIGVAMKAHWQRLLILGVLLVLVGLVGLYAASLLVRTMTLLVAALLVIAGALQLSQAFLLRGLPSFAMTIALGAAQIIGGIAIYTHPEWAAYAVATTVAAVLVVQALAQFSLAFGFSAGGHRWISLASGVIALVAAVICVTGVAWAGRASASWGIGVAMLAMGAAYIAIALLARHEGEPKRPSPSR
ncbi:DUF308 domain-containing protein [Stenotrophomonas sp. PS02289]|uniref:DUF308 domain-containing protein n=1 Tax=Stenotrophomonas sp. PS02289 TaxID=2991422 RepID=UPI00249AAFF2|nr:DUF308 domain-containing protein [Stenotrophomonas sp. PS02289]